MYPLLTVLIVIKTAVADVPWSATPFNPLAVPLAVRSPYLSCWLAGGNNGGKLAGQWPQFWNGMTTSWGGYVRVDNSTFVYMGQPDSTTPLAKQIESNFTATQSSFRQTAGDVTVTVSFLSPIEPNDLLRQSLPFSYMSVSVEPNDGLNHSVQIYSDITGEWITGDASWVANWTTYVDDVVTHQFQLQNPEPFTEINDRTQYGAAYYSATGGTYQTGAYYDVRAQFRSYGFLNNTQDTNYRAVNDSWPIFAHAIDLGTVSSRTQPIVFSVGHVRDPLVQYILPNATIQQRRSYLFSAFDNVLDAISFFLGDYSNALSSANAFDAHVQSDASAISDDYASIVALSARQAFGRIEITIGSSSEDILVFLKEGNVNTVDVLFAAYPIFLYTNPALAAYLLEPLLQYQASGQYPRPWAVHDMGTQYPNAMGHNDDSGTSMPVEESGNMVIMTAAYVKFTGNTSLASTYYSLLQQWTSYLITNCLTPAIQYSTDEFAGMLANQTNLAIKGIVGIAAMAQMAAALGKTADAQNYSSIAQSYAAQLPGLATSKDGSHLVLSYGNDSSWGITYNLYADRLLGTNVFPESLYEMQTAWYPIVSQSYGVPLDTRNLYTKTDWEIIMSAAVTSNSTRDLFIDSVAAFQKAGLTNEPFPDVYDTNTGNEDVIQFRGRPVVGGHFARLVLSRNDPVLNSTGTSGGPTTNATIGGTPNGDLSKGAVAGIVLGAVFVVGLPVLFAWRRNSRSRELRRHPENTGQAVFRQVNPDSTRPPQEPTPFIAPHAGAPDRVDQGNGKAERTNSSSSGIQRSPAERAREGRAPGPSVDDPALAQRLLHNAATVDLVTILNHRLRREQADNVEDPPEYA